MAEYLTNTTDLTSVANAIRTKGGTTAQLVYPSGFVSAINAIETGGGGTPIAESDITFYDYDGTIVAAWTLAELATKTELPAYPSHDGLTCQGWNWTLADLKSTNRKMNVGAMYITDDGKTRIYIHLEEGRTSPMLGCCPNGTVTVDWGDGTTPDILTGTSTSTAQWTPNHAYAAPGDYVIKLTVAGTFGIAGNESYNEGCALLRFSSSANVTNSVYRNAINKIEIGSGITSLNNGTLYSCRGLESITIPEEITGFRGSCLSENYGLKAVIVPNGITEIAANLLRSSSGVRVISIPNGVKTVGVFALNGNQQIESITLPDGITRIGMYALQACRKIKDVQIPTGVTKIDQQLFSACYGLRSCKVPNGVTEIAGSAFAYCETLASFTIPSEVAAIGARAFYGCYGTKYYDFSNHTSIPTLANTDAFTSIPDDCEIRVPAALTDEWKAATNWATYADNIVAIGKGVSGVSDKIVLYNQTIPIEISFVNFTGPPVYRILSSATNIATISDDQATKDKITFNVNSLSTEGNSTISVAIVSDTEEFVEEFTVKVYETIPASTYTVNAVSDAAYGFTLNSSGYYESQNKAKANSYALCKVNISNAIGKKVYFDCINYAESNYDFGILGNVNQELSKSNAVDSTYKKSFKGSSSANVQTVEYDDATGDCFIEVKFRKNNSGDKNNDSLQFKVRFEE